MTPPGNGGKRAPHLTLVSNGLPVETTVPDSAAADPVPPSGPGPRPSSLSLPPLPPRSADVLGLRTLIARDTATTTNFQHLQNFLAELANPTAMGGYDVHFQSRNLHFYVTQAGPGEAVQVVVRSQALPTGPGNTAVPPEPLFNFSYLPDGSITSRMHETPHASPEGGPENTYHSLLRATLSERAQRLVRGEDLFTRLSDSLRALRGRYTPESQSVWYDNFVVYEGKVYSFRRLNLQGLSDLISGPQLNQIAIFEETGTEQVRIATISANGEFEFNPERSGREPLSHNQLGLLDNLVPMLEQAKVEPSAYQTRLQRALQALPNFRNLSPSIERSVEIPRSFSIGSSSGGYMAEYRRGWDLFGSLFESQRWQNPENPNDVRRLSPPWRLKRAMTYELLRWAGNTTIYGLTQNIRDPKAASDSLSLFLHPEGGGRLSIYRNSQLHDLILANPNGSVWRADQEIRQMEREKLTFPDRMSAIRAAVARHTQNNNNSPFTLQVQEAPTFDLNRFHLDPQGTAIPIRTAQQAWDLLRLQIAPGVKPRVEFRREGDVVGNLLGNSGEPNRILVDFHESQPALHLDISHQGMKVGEGEIPIVQVLMRRGEDTHARVFQEGLLRPDMARDVHQEVLRTARQGALPRSLPTRIASLIPRTIYHTMFSGRIYGVSYYASLPFILGYERLIYNETERRLIGTPGFQANFTLNYFLNNVAKPYVAMALPSSVATLMVDGAFNALPGIRSSLATWQSSEATLAQAFRMPMNRPSFYNPSNIARPVGPNFFFRGFLQRAVPLFVGMTAIDHLHTGQWMSPMFWRNMRDVAAVSAGSAAFLRLVYASPTLSSALVRRRLLVEGAAGAGGASFALTGRGGIALAALEMIALGIINAHERRSLLDETGRALRAQLGQAIDRRNEVITRLESGEEVAPRYLVSADTEVHNTQAAYRRFLQLTDHTTGTGNFSPIGSSNDFDAEMIRYERERALLNASPGDTFAAARIESEHLERLRGLRSRYERMETDLDRLYASYGSDATASGESGPSLRDFLRSAAQAQNAGNSEVPQAEPPVAITSPVAVNSEEGRAIVEQLRWKAADDPSSILWSRERRASYILQEFRGYRVSDPTGGRRPWNRAEAMAFLDAVDQANTERVRSLEAPITMPGTGDQFDTRRLESLLASERTIREREAASHSHAAEHSNILADNATDLDRQLEAYYRSSNERMATALSRFMDTPAIAMASTPSPTVALQ